MPRQRMKGMKAATYDLPPELIDAVNRLARETGRSARDEVQHALERHLAQPPTVRVEAEPLAPAEVQPERRKRGRPKGRGGKS